MMPVLFSAPTLIITDLKKAFAVFGRMSIRLAICLVLRSWSRRSTVSRSRRVIRNFRATLSRFSAPRGFLSKCLPIRRVVGRGRGDRKHYRQDLEEMLGNAETLRNNKEREDILIGLGNSETNGKSGACKALSGALSKV